MSTILLIEDNYEILDNTAELLELEGYEVVTASNGSDGITIANKVLPDLIISDIMMPGMDGYEVLKKANNNPDTRSIPFIFLTAKAEKSEKKLGLDLGADDYLTKPINTRALLKSIGNCLQKKNDLLEQYQNNLQELDDYILSRRMDLLDWLSDDQYGI